MNPNTRRLLGYPLAAMIAGGLGWLAFGYEPEADYLTLLNSANIHAELAASIPADTTNVEGRALRDRLIGEAYQWLARAEAVEANTSACGQVRAFLASAEGRPRVSASLYRQCRELPDTAPEQVGPLALREAQALSNADDFAGALRVLEEPVMKGPSVDATQRDALRVRVLFRAGQTTQAQLVAESMVARSAAGSEPCRVAASLLESLGAYSASEAGWRKAETDESIQEYHFARLKLRASESEEARVLLERSLSNHNPDVLRRMAEDKQLWVAALGDEQVQELLRSPTGTPAAAGR